MLYEKVEFRSSESLSVKALSIIDYPMHKHDNAFQVMLVLKGEIELYLVNMYETLSVGDIQICNPNELHSLRALTEDNVVLFLYINSDDCNDTFHDLNTYIFTTRNIDKNSSSLQKLRANIRTIAEHYFEDKHRYGELDTFRNDIVNVMIDYFQFYYILDDSKLHASEVYKKNEIQIDRIRRANNYIYENYNKQIKLEDLAEIENITPQHLTYILKSGGGVGFRKLLNMSRVEKSSHLLLGGNKSLQSISFECGFSKYQYFKETFKKFYGLSPADFRKKYKETIDNKVPMYTMPERNQVIGLLKEMGSSSRDIVLEFNAINAIKPFIKYNSARLDLQSYNHLTSFDLIKDAVSETSLENVYLDGAFIAEHKSVWGNFTKIIMDLTDIHLNIKIAVDANTKAQKFDSIIRFLYESTETIGKIPDLIIFHVDASEENAQKLLQIAKINHVDAALRNAPNIQIKLPIENPGFVPTYMLDVIDRNENEYINSITLINDIQADKNTHLEEFGLIDRSGLKLLAYHLYFMLKRMGKYLVEKGNDYFITTNETKSDIQFLFFNYTEELIELVKSNIKETESPYDNLRDSINRNIDYNVSIDGLDGFYAIRKYRMNGDDFNSRFNPGFDLSKLSKDSLRIFNESLEPAKSVNFVKSKNNYTFSFSLSPFEIMLISVEQI